MRKERIGSIRNEQKKRKTRIKEKRGQGVGPQGALGTKSVKKGKKGIASIE
jgi:hypothetical protein